MILFYVRGGVRNPHLDTQIRQLDLSGGDIDALVDFIGALNGEGLMDRAPTALPRQAPRSSSGPSVDVL